MSKPNTNYRAALAQLQTALANLDQAVGDLHSEHVKNRSDNRGAFNAELVASLDALKGANGLLHATLDAKLLLEDAGAGDVPCNEVIDAAVANVHARAAALETSRGQLATARKALDGRFDAGRDAAKSACETLCALKKPADKGSDKK